VTGGRDDRLVRLTQVGGALKDAALSRLRRAAAECRRIEAAIAALDAEARRAAEDTDIAHRAVSGASLEQFYRKRRTALNAELARARAAEARLMAEAARAFGRDEALNRLAMRSGPR
jgi:hypothetical protein